MKNKRMISVILLIVVVILQFKFISFIDFAKAETKEVDNESYEVKLENEHYKYYYAQLNSMAKKIYDAMYDMYIAGDLKTGTKNYDLIEKNYISEDVVKAYQQGDNAIIEAVETARDAFYLDYPEVFYINMEKFSIRITNGNGKYHLWLGTGNDTSYMLHGFENAEQINLAENQYENALNNIVNEAKKLENSKEKITYVHNKIVESADYKLDNVCKTENRGHIRTPYGALVAKEAVCEGYSKSVKVALDKLGIPCILVRGVYKEEGSTNGENHMWNYVQIDGKWYAVDATFDDNNGKVAFNDYLIVGYSTMQKAHNPTGLMSCPNFEFKLPELEYEDFGIEQAYDYKGLVVNYGMTTGETLDGDAFVGGKFYINYKNMGMKTARDNGYYFLVRYEQEGNWFYMESFRPEYNLYGAGIIEDSNKELIFYNSNVKYLEFAVTDVKYKEPITGYETINNKIVTNQVYTGDENRIITKTDPIDNIHEWKPSPNMISASPYLGTKLKPGKATHIKITYNDILVPSEDGEKPSIYVESNAWTDSAEINSKIENFGYEKNTIWFDFTPSSMWGDNSVIYNFKVKGLVGNWSKLAPRASYYYVQESFGCTYSMAQSNKWRVYARPTLIDTTDIDFNGWEFDDGVVTSEEAKILNQVKDRMALVVTPTNKAQETEIEGLIENTKEKPEVLGMECYNINLVVCNKNVLKTANGDKMTVYLGFPEGYGPESEGVTFKTYHVKNENGKNVIEEIECVITPYGLLVNCDSFSPYAVAVVKSTEETEKTTKSVVVSYGENGKITNLSEKIISIAKDSSINCSVVADEGYVINSLTVGGKEISEALGKSSYDLTINYSDILGVNNIVNATFVAKTIVQAEEQRGENVVTPTIPRDFEISLVSEKETVYPGEIFEVSCSIKNIRNIDEGIIAIIGKLEIDESLVEIQKVDDDVLVGENKWNLSAFNNDNFKFVADNAESITADSSIFKIRLKAKENITTQQIFKIKVTDVSASGGKGIVFPVSDTEETVNIMIKEVEEVEKITSDKYVISDENSKILGINPNTTVAEFKKNVDTKQTIEFLDKDNKNLEDTSVITTGTKINVGKTLQYTLIVIGDVDGDGRNTVNDLAKVKLHYIGKEILTGIYLDAADMDGSNTLTINDVAKLKLELIK